jgi:hypothetical protein
MVEIMPLPNKTVTSLAMALWNLQRRRCFMLDDDVVVMVQVPLSAPVFLA